MSRALIVIGIVIILIGVLWPWLGRLGLGHLPGDIVIDRGNVKFYLPITTYLLISVAISLVLWVMNRRHRARSSPRETHQAHLHSHKHK